MLISLKYWHDVMPRSKLFKIFDHIHFFDPVKPRTKHAVTGGGVVPAADDQWSKGEVNLSPRIRQPWPETEGGSAANGDIGISESSVVKELIPAALHHHLTCISREMEVSE